MADLPSCLIWLVSVKYILAWKDKSSELRDRLHCFRNKITGNLVGIQAEQGPRTHDLNCLICGINHPCEWRDGCMDQQCEDSRRMDDLVSALGELALRETRIKGTRDAILEIERQAKNVNGRNVMW